MHDLPLPADAAPPGPFDDERYSDGELYDLLMKLAERLARDPD